VKLYIYYFGYWLYSIFNDYPKRKERRNVTSKKKNTIEYEKIININPLIGVASTAGYFCNFFL
jgi:hypothetical protein